MVSITSLLRFMFVFCVITVGIIGFIFKEIALFWLAITNGFLLLFTWIIIRLKKTTPSISKPQKDSIEKNLDEQIIEEKTESKASHHTHHQQFVKYNYNHKKKTNPSFFWLTLIIVVIISLYLIDRSLSSSQKSTTIPQALTGYAQEILAQSDDFSGSNLSGNSIIITGEVLSTGNTVTPLTGISVNTAFIGSGETTPKTEPIPVPVVVEKRILSGSTLKFTNTQSVSLLEAIVYLLQTHNTSLYSKKDLTFGGITTKNPYYKYWYTAYKMGLVGSTSSPSTLISCQTYMVLKGMLEKWDVQYTNANVKNKFWIEAQKRDVLNGCGFGKLLKGANLE